MGRIHLQNLLNAGRAFICATVAVGLCPFLSLPAFAQAKPKEPPQLAEDLRETVAKVRVTVPLPSGAKYTGQMVVTYYRPQTDGPYPIVIFNHGRSGTKDARAETPRFRHLAIARYFVRRGFAVFAPTRLGYGESGVEIDPEMTKGSCNDPDYHAAMEAMLIQTLATANFAKTFPWADGNRIVVGGQSYGGFAAIGASASKQLSALGAINFAGGAGGLLKKPGHPCGPSQIAAAIASAGKQAKAPMLWLYAENDSLWGAELPRKWYAAYVKAGGKAEMIMFPPVGDDGHQLIGTAFRQWRPLADRFLQKLGFPVPHTPDAPSATDFARLEDAEKVPYVRARTDGYQKFLDADVPRAFVVSTKGAWAWRSGENSAERALQACREHSTGYCHLYAVDDAVVFKPPESAEARPAR